MSNTVEQEDIRLVKMEINNLGINYLHRTNPWSAAWWSAAFPGCGHLHLGALLKGLIFISGEMIINTKARINLAIYYTFIGNFEKADYVFNGFWGLFYIAVWVFAIYDAYTLAIEINQLCDLEENQDKRYFRKFTISAMGVNNISQRSPIVASFFSTVVGGMGQAYNLEFGKGFVLISWVVIINYFSKFNYLVYKTICGQEIFLNQVDWQWLLYMPSIMAFCIWDSYVGSVEINKLLVEEQRYTFGKKKNFHDISEGSSYPLYLVGTCKQSINLELIVNIFKIKGLNKYEIIFLDKLNNDNKKIGDSIRQSDGISNINGAMCGAAILMLFGTIWGGTIIPGGPIAVGLAGFLIGGIIGYILDRYVIGWIRAKLKVDPIKGSNSVDGEVMILVKVNNKKQHDFVNNIFVQKNVNFVGNFQENTLVNLLHTGD